MCAAVNNVKRLVSLLAAFAVAVCCMSISPSAASGEEEQLSMEELVDRMGVVINEARADAGLKPLYIVPYLNDCAQVRSRECIKMFSHDRPYQNDNGKAMGFNTVIDDDLVPYDHAAEDIAAGSNTAEATLEQWHNSPVHWDYIMNTAHSKDDPSETYQIDFDYIGIGVAFEENSEWGWYWTILLIDCDEDLSGAYMPERYKIVPKCPGDLTGDGKLNQFDYIVLSRHIVYGKYINDLQKESADLFKDGQLSIADAVVLKRYLLGRYKTLPVTLDMLG